MRRYYCWTAILATWTIVGTLRNTLAKEQPLGNRVERVVVENRASHNAILVGTSADKNALGRRTKRYDAYEDQREPLPLTSYLEPITGTYRGPRDPPRNSQRERDDRNDKGLRERPFETTSKEWLSLKSSHDGTKSGEKINRKASSVRSVKRDDSRSTIEFDGPFDERGGRERKASGWTAKWEAVEKERQTLRERSVGKFPRANRLISGSLVNYANGANLALKQPSSYESKGTRQGFRDVKKVEKDQPRFENVDVADNQDPGERLTGVTEVVEGKAEKRELSATEKYDIGESKRTYVWLRTTRCSERDEHDPYPRAVENGRKNQLKGNTERKEMKDFAGNKPPRKTHETSEGHPYLPRTKLQLRQGPTESARRQIKGKNQQTKETSSRGPINPRQEGPSDRRRNLMAELLPEKDPTSIGEKLKSFRESWRIRGGVAIKSEMKVAPDKRSRKPGTQDRMKDIARLLYSGKRERLLDENFKDDFRKHELRTVQRAVEGDTGGRTKRELIKSTSLLANSSADIFTSNRYLFFSAMQDSPTKSWENHERDWPEIQEGEHKEEPAMKSTLTSAKLSARSESAGYNSGGISQQDGIDAASTIESDNVREPSGAERSSIARDIIANRSGQSAAIKNFQGEFREDGPRRAPRKTMSSERPGELSINSYRLSRNLGFSKAPHFKPYSTGKNFTDASKSYRSAVASVKETKFKVLSTARTQNLMEHVGSPLKYTLSKTDLGESFNESDAISSTYREANGSFTTSEYLSSIPDASSRLKSSGENQANLNNEQKDMSILGSNLGDDVFEPDKRIYSVNRPTSESIENDDYAEKRTSTAGEHIVSVHSENLAIQVTPLVSRGIDSEMPIGITNMSAEQTTGPPNEISFRLGKIATHPTHKDRLSRIVPMEIDVTSEPRSPAASLAPEISHDSYDDNKEEQTRQPKLESPEDDANLSPTPTSLSSNTEQQTVITIMDDSIDATDNYTHSIGQGNELSLFTEEWQNEIVSNETQISNENDRDGQSQGIKRAEPQKITRAWRNHTSEEFISVRPEIVVESSNDRSISQNVSGNTSSRSPMYFSSWLAERFVTSAAQRDLSKPTSLGRKRSEQSNRQLSIDAAHRDTHDSKINEAKNPTGSTFSASLVFHKNRHEVIPGESREITTSKLSTLRDERGKLERVYDAGNSKKEKHSAVSTTLTVTLTDEYLRNGDHSKSYIKEEQSLDTGVIGIRTTPAESSVVHPTWATTRNNAAYLSSSPTSQEIAAERLALQNEFLHTSTLSPRSASYQHWPMDEWMFNDEVTARRYTTGQPADQPSESALFSNQVASTLSQSNNPVFPTTADNYDDNDSTGSTESPGEAFGYDDDLYLTLSRGNVSSNDSWDSERGKSSPRKLDNSSHESAPIDQWPVKHSAVVEGDLVLGGLMMVHEREDTVTCGPVMPQGGVQALEAMLYTLDKLNEGGGIVPGVKIGAHILDDCDKDTYGLEMAVDFIKGSISNIDGAEYHCNRTAVRKVISGVVGAASSVTSIQVANLLRLFRIPQVSFFSTSPELSNKQRFEYFTRTIPSDHYQVKAMVDIVRKMGWSYVSIIYEESNYGIKAFEELEELLKKHQICIAIKEKLVKDSGVAEETAYDNIVLKLLTKPRARGCIIFGSDQEVAGVMRAVRRCNATGAFSWIGSDGWSARGLVSDDNEPEVEGTLSVQPQANPVKGFEEYFLNLTVENNRRNPWFVEFWERHFQCRYPNASRTPYNQKYTKACTTKERLTKQNTAFEDQLQFVSDAVMAFAYALRDMHIDLCGGQAGLCDAMKPTKGTELLKYLRKVEFEGLSGDQFKFDKNGDGPARYNIIHFKQTSPGEYKWIRVGKYLEGELRLNMSEIQFKLGHPQPPESVCSLPCEVGQAKKYVEGERCCWHCFNCTQYQIRDPDDETQCMACRQGTVPDETHSTCRDIPEEFLRPESGWAIGAMSFSATGILVTLFVGGVFLRHNDTPVVRASGRELSYVLLSGILLCYLVTFALVLRPTDIVCGIQRFAAGFCFTVVYAALLTKTNRILRIFNASKRSAKRPSFISPRSQLIICSGLVGVQILINGVWMVIDPARAMHHYPTREDNLLVCNSYIDASYMIVFTYPIILIVVCTIYAVLTRKTPEAFNESKHIGFTMYTTCVIWLAFVPLYFGTGNHVALRITSMSVTISLSASVTIACLFSPKLYIILIRPERNVRQSMMPARYSTTKNSAVSGTNASNMMAHVTLTAVTCNQKDALKKHVKTTVDGFTQSEYHELEPLDQKNGKPAIALVSRDTQTPNNNNECAMDGEKDAQENVTSSKQFNRIGNGPVSQSDVSL